MRRNGKRGLSLNFPGPTIEDMAWMLEREFREHGAEAPMSNCCR